MYKKLKLVLYSVNDRVCVNGRTGVLYARKFDQSAQNLMAGRTNTPKIEWLAYTYAEK